MKRLMSFLSLILSASMVLGQGFPVQISPNGTGFPVKVTNQVVNNESRTLVSSPRLQTYSSRTIATAGVWDLQRKRLKNLVPEPLSAIVFAFSNHMVAGGFYEGATANSITVAGAVQAYGANANDESTPRLPITFNGQLTVSIPPKGVVLSDPVPISVLPNAEYWVRVGVTVPSNGGVYPAGGSLLGGTATYGVNNGEGGKLGQATNADLYQGGSTIGVGPQLLYYGPEAVYGITRSGKIYSAILFGGDSIFYGYTDPGDNDGSYAALGNGGIAARAATELGIPFIQGAYSGESGFSSTGGFINAWERLCRDGLARYVDRVVVNYGRNDINVREAAGDTPAQILTYLKSGVMELVKQICGRGQHLGVCTVLPTPGSTTGYTTAAGMIIADPLASTSGGKQESARQQYNNWLRDTSSVGAQKQVNTYLASVGLKTKFYIFDICSDIETNQSGALTPNGGAFLVPATTTIYDSGTASSGSTVQIVDATKSWTPNQFRGRVVWIYGGQGQYSTGVIQYNSATTLYLITPLSGSATANNTSQYRIIEAATGDATHPSPWGSKIIANSIKPKLAEFAALPTGI